MPGFVLSGVVLDALDPRALGAFYQRLTGWEVIAAEPDWFKIAADR